MLKIGVFGAHRGMTMINVLLNHKDAKLVAVCDKYKPSLDHVAKSAKEVGMEVTLYENFEDFIKHDMDAVVLANYANEHATFAIRCLKAGKHVLSEVLPCETMSEAVDLIEAVEETGLVYAYAENYCYMRHSFEMKMRYEAGDIGDVTYAEGEYIHDCTSIWPSITYGDPDHWRNRIHPTYYCTHSIGPVLTITGRRPVKVVGFEAPLSNDYQTTAICHGPAIIMLTLDNGAVVRSVHGDLKREPGISTYMIYGQKGMMEAARFSNEIDINANGTNIKYHSPLMNVYKESKNFGSGSWDRYDPEPIRALEQGIAVFSECTSAVTMKNCVRLCETVEKTGGKYMLAENYPFSAALLEMERLQADGTLGRVLYAEGEYNHTGTKETLKELTPEKYHWRAYLPRTYYVTHSLGPLMHITKQNPVQVSAFAVHSNVLEEYDDFRHNVDAFAMMNCITEDGALFRFTGCAHMGSHSGYRICSENGSTETGRSLGGQVNLVYHNWCTPEGKESSQTYAPEFTAHADEASKAGHGGSDFWTVYNFVNYLKNDVAPFFDVYRGCCMSAVAILGWRSCLENGRVYKIPDFKNKEERDAWRNDDLTPFPDENGNTMLPCAIPWKK